MARGQRDNKLQRTRRVATAAKLRLHRIPDVAPEVDGVRIIRYAQRDLSHRGAGRYMNHQKAIERHQHAASVRGESSGQHERELGVPEVARVEER